MLVRQLILNDFTDDGVEQKLAAEYWMQDGELQADYKLDGIRAWMENEGIRGMDGALFPRDGQPFLDTLPAVMSRSSTFTTMDVDR